MIDNDLPEQLTIDWLHEKYINQELTPEEVINKIIVRVGRDKSLNIWITPPSPELAAPFLETLRGTDPASSMLWGIPFAIKDNIDLANVPTTAACPDYAYIPKESATTVQRLISAGAIPLGKTNLDQFATGLVGTRSPYGEVHNAYRGELISGGSSSGSAVAVARGQAAFSLGTDTAGSGRIPAALNRLFGFKSSLGAWSAKGVVPACASLDCITVFTTNIKDIELVDAAVRYEDDYPWSRSITLLPSAMPEKVYIPDNTPAFFGNFSEQYRTAWNKTVERLKSFITEVEYIDYSIFSQAAALLYDGPWVAERWADLGDFVEANPKKTFPVTEKILRLGASQDKTAAAAFSAMHKIQVYRHTAQKLLRNAVLVTPTAGGTFTREEVDADPVATNSAMGLYTNHCNLLDLCAISVPVQDAAEDMPFGVTFFSNSQNEHLILGMAKAFSSNH